MARYGISTPITGYVYCEVEAESEEEALELAKKKDLTSDDIESWDTCETIVEGNVFYGIMNSTEIEEV